MISICITFIVYAILSNGIYGFVFRRLFDFVPSIISSAQDKLFESVRTPILETSNKVGLVVPEGPSVPLQYEPVYSFGKGLTSANKNDKTILGGKGANLADMSAIGLSVPPGFTITTEVCAAFHTSNKLLPATVWPKILTGLELVEKEMNRKFGDREKPLLVSVRSGAAVSMPGMMDTILNLGLNDETVIGLSADFGDRFAMDSYRRFLNMFGTVVLNIPHHAFEERMSELKKSLNIVEDNDLTTDHLKLLVEKYKQIYVEFNCVFPTNPYAQLHAAIHAVFDSWNSDRAIKYRDAEGIVGLLGTAVNVQAMCFGNMGETSGTGVCFTRNPNTGEKKLYGEYLINAQGEDVVAGIRTPLPISKLKDSLPDAYTELLKNVKILETYYKDMQDIEFTIQEGKLYMLQTRNGKRVGPAAVKIAVDTVNEKLNTKEKAIMMVKPEHLNQLLLPQFVSIDGPQYADKVIAKGLPASPGAAVGVVVFSPEAAEASFAKGVKCILVRDDTSPEDVGGMWASEGVLTARGGMTSHAAVVARGWGKPCICGCADLQFGCILSDDVNCIEPLQIVTVRKPSGETVTFKEGDYISLNGDTGEILIGQQDLRPPSIDSSSDTKTFMEWVDEKRKMKVLANADTPTDAQEARKNGAEGIGLCRTEHMFFSEDRIRVVRRMILSTDPAFRKKALDELLPFQRSDFEGILEAMDGLPVTVRLLDPPLHEFLPEPHAIDEEFAKDVGMSKDECIFAIERLQETNPMLGLRGCRLGVILPELVEMQSRALIEASLNNKYLKGLDPRPEIMIPLISTDKEFIHQSNIIRSTANQVFKEWGGKSLTYKLGTMIEVPRAALTAEAVCKAGADFFSYGTNDLTQMTFGFSRDDIGGYLPTYLKNGILEFDPFQTIDEIGVGSLIVSSAAAGRKVATAENRNFKAGVCGEQGGDPKSVRFFVKSGMDYVSCSPFRVPVARLAAAQSEVENEEETKKKEKQEEYTNNILRWFRSGKKLYSNRKLY